MLSVAFTFQSMNIENHKFTFIYFQGVDDWNFDTFGLDRVSKGSPLKYIGYELLTKYGCLHKYKVCKI